MAHSPETEPNALSDIGDAQPDIDTLLRLLRSGTSVEFVAVVRARDVLGASGVNSPEEREFRLPCSTRSPAPTASPAS